MTRFISKAMPTLAATTALVASAVGPTVGTASAADVKCLIKISDSGQTKDFQGLLIANGDVSGSFRFSVTGSGHGNSSEIVQSGDFSAARGHAVEAGSVTLNGSSRYTAQLKVWVGGRTYVCSDRI